jgi:hypothetical protein
MFRAVVALVLTASSEASRVKVDGGSESKSQTKFGASCDDLQAMFHDRVVAFKSSLDANPDLDEIGRVAQARVMMRTYGIIRTLRRARACSWVIENDNDDIKQAREIVQTLLAENPCADAARSQLAAGASDSTNAQMEVQSIYRAMAILASDNCELVESGEQIDSEATLDEEALDESALDIELSETEAAVQDAIDDIVDSSQDGESAFIQTKSNEGSFGGFMRIIGVVFWMLFLMLACISTYAIIGFLITITLSTLVAAVSPSWRREMYICFSRHCHGSNIGIVDTLFGSAILGYFAGMASGVVGIAGCSYQMYNQLLPGQ